MNDSEYVVEKDGLTLGIIKSYVMTSGGITDGGDTFWMR